MALFGTKKTEIEKKKPAAKTAKAKAAKPAQPEKASMQDLYSETAPVKAGVQAAPKTGAARGVLLKPVITEKATNLVAAGKYAFMVALDANKISVAKAVKAVYGVTPIAVNIIRSEGKMVARGKVRGQRSDSKKAVVTLKKGETIKIYEGV